MKQGRERKNLPRDMMFYYTKVSVTMYCTKCAIYSTAALTQAWQM